MDSTKPFIEEITLENILNHLMDDFKNTSTKLTLTSLGNEVFGTYKNMQRTRRQERSIRLEDCHLLLDKIKELSIKDSNSRSLIEILTTWFPALSICQTEEEIRAIVIANLMGTASSKPSVPTMTYVGSKAFFHSCLNYSSPIQSIQMMFQTGWNWVIDKTNSCLLIDLAKKGIEIQIVANCSSPMMKSIARAMDNSNDRLRYLGFNNTLAKWHTYEETYPNIHLHVSSKYPIFRRSYIVHFQDHTSRSIFYDYAYGPSGEQHSIYTCFTHSDPTFQRIETEFRFLWEHSDDYEIWKKAQAKPVDFLPPGEYLLIYPSYEKEHFDRNAKPNWKYGALAIESDNKARLRSNAFPSFQEAKELLQKSEFHLPYALWDSKDYSYSGDVKLARNNIYISLDDNEQQEVLHLSLSRPLRNKDRFLGIITGLNPSGDPIALKCACIGTSIVPKINISFLNELLYKQKAKKQNAFLSLETPDINRFYSDCLFEEAIDM